MSDVLLETRDLSRRFGGVTAVDQVNFALAPGELRCLIGPNGAGKSTFFKMLSGQIRPSEGDIYLRGERMTGAQPHEIARRGVGTKTQVPSVYDGLAVRENLELAALRRHGKRAARAAAERLLDRMALGDLAATPVGHLAHGQRQWVELGIVLAGGPELILLDEPTAGMTKDEVARTAELIEEINRDHALVVVEHDMQFIRMIARLVTVFHQGRIVAQDEIGAILANPLVRDIYLGRKAAADA